MMTPRENMMAVLSGTEDPAWMPACVHITNENNLPGFLPPELLAEPLDLLRISEFVGGDLLYEIQGVCMRSAAGFGTESVKHGDLRRTTLTTPLRSLTEEILFSDIQTPFYRDLPPGYVLPGPVVNSAYTKHFVAAPADFEVIRHYHEALTFVADHGVIDDEIRRVGDKGVVILGGGPPSPLYSLMSAYAGLERLIYDLCDARQEVEAAMQAIQEAACRWYETAAATSCEVIRCTEDLDTKLVSPAMFRQYAVPALKEYARICHLHGKLFVIHMCGHIRDFLPHLRDIGADAIHCLTTPPMGNTTVSEARRVLAGRTAAMIRVDADLLLNGNGKQLDASIGSICTETAGWRNVLVIIPCGRAALENIRRVIDRVHERGQWNRKT